MIAHRYFQCLLAALLTVSSINIAAHAGRTPRHATSPGGDRATGLPALVSGLHRFRATTFDSSSDKEFDRLIGGISHFEIADFPAQRRLFQKLAHGQHPKALFVTCSDSRIDPNLITHCHPGDLFVLRNIGNIVPAYRSGEHSEAAVIEYAVRALDVREIIICGHLNCGALKALTEHSRHQDMPELRRWLSFDQRLDRILKDRYPHRSQEEQQKLAAEENVLVQIENLSSHPCVKQGLARGTLKIHGWIYCLDRGQVFNFDPAAGQFVSLSHQQAARSHHTAAHH